MKKLNQNSIRVSTDVTRRCHVNSGLALASNPNRGNNITPVNCTGNPTDRALIQSAINNAGSGDTIMLVGTCQLDGTRVFITKSNLTITGAGAAGNWSTVVKGIASTSGTPVGDNGFPDFLLFNRGFQIGDISGNSVVKNVGISNIKFSTLNRAVIVSPQIGEITTNVVERPLARVLPHRFLSIIIGLITMIGQHKYLVRLIMLLSKTIW